MRLNVRNNITLPLLALIGLSACAKQMAPPGGPRDTTPPQIESTEPASGTTGLATDAPLVIAFSEAMQREEVERALSIFPAPEHPPDLKWHGSRLRITPDTAWSRSQTYVVTLQADARDRRGNVLPQSLQFAFSTGTTIDSGIITGTVLSAGRPRAGAMALCYRLGGEDPDPETDTADYLVQTDSTGAFRFGFLSPGTYRIYALEDRDHDWLWYAGAEPIANPAHDLTLAASADSVALPPLALTVLDTVTPRVTDCRAVSPTCIRIDFDAGFDSLDLAGFHVTAASANNTRAADALYTLDSLATLLFATFAGPLEPAQYDIIVAGTPKGDGSLPVDTCATTIPDSWDTLFQPVRAILPDSVAVQNAAADSVLLTLRAPAAQLSGDSLRWTTGDSTQIATTATPLHPFAVSIIVPPALRLKGPLTLSVPERLIRNASGSGWPDSAITILFRFPHLDSAGDYEVSLTPDPPAPFSEYRLGLKPGHGAPQTLWQTLDSLGSAHGYLAPGAYQAIIHHDRNHNGRRDLGWPHPIRFAEPVWRFHDSLTVRARFTTELSLSMPARK